jgi:sugar O-acyltransferase (sialic acid O-acetyltransferase NeuD family)
MTLPLYGVFGASGLGREVMPLLRAQLQQVATIEQLVFIDDAPPATQLNGHAVLSWTEFLAHPASQRSVALAIANSSIRETLAQRCQAAGVVQLSVQASNVVRMDDITLGEGALLSPFVTLTSNIRIGRCFHANIYSYVAHDCVIGNFVTFAPGVMCNGNVHIEDHAYIGTGAVLKQGTPDKPLVIGRGAVVGMGAVVTKSVPAGVTVVGNPARPLVK